MRAKIIEPAILRSFASWHPIEPIVVRSVSTIVPPRSALQRAAFVVFFSAIVVIDPRFERCPFRGVGNMPTLRTDAAMGRLNHAGDDGKTVICLQERRQVFMDFQIHIRPVVETGTP